jgi:hypothetical protein
MPSVALRVKIVSPGDALTNRAAATRAPSNDSVARAASG